MKLTKLLIAFLLVISFGCSKKEEPQAVVYEPDTEGMSEFLYAIIDSSTNESMSIGNDPQDLSVGIGIPIYQADENNKLTLSDTVDFPVYENDKIIGVMSRFPLEKEGYGYNYGEVGTEELTEALSDGTRIIIVFIGSNLSLFVTDTRTIAYGYQGSVDKYDFKAQALKYGAVISDARYPLEKPS